jgi:hypothetical protein
MADFARVHSISHVRIRYAQPSHSASTATWLSGHDPTRRELVDRPAGQRIRLSIVAQTAPIVSTTPFPADPGPYAVVRDGITERVLQQSVVIVPTPIIQERAQGEVISVGPEKKRPTRLRGAGGRFISTKSEEAIRAAMTPTGSAATTVKTGSAGSVKTVTGKRRHSVETRTAPSAEAAKIRTGAANTPSTPTTKKPRGPKVRTKK